MNTENNKIIAEFLTGKEADIFHFPKFQYYTTEGVFKDYFTFNQLEFHSNWNWLMEVVEKIESLEDTERFEITNSGVNITHYQTKEVKFIYNGGHTNNGMYLMTEKAVETKKEAIYNACVEFIKWYNEQKS